MKINKNKRLYEKLRKKGLADEIIINGINLYYSYGGYQYYETINELIKNEFD